MPVCGFADRADHARRLTKNRDFFELTAQNENIAVPVCEFRLRCGPGTVRQRVSALTVSLRSGSTAFF